MIILASKSPRRKELMKDICPSFSIETEEINEESSYTLSPLEAVIDIAFRKGEVIAKKHKDDIVISADTIVTINGMILGKPKDKNDAKRMLNLLSNKTHQVITAYTIFYKDKVIKNHVITDVTFEDLSEELIDSYIDSNSPMDKAGAYGIQDDASFHLVKKIKGSYLNVVGFPVEEIKNDLNTLNIK